MKGHTPLFDEAVWSAIPQEIPGEPSFPAVTGVKILKSLFFYVVFASIIWPLSFFVAPVFFVLMCVYGYPPHVPGLREGGKLLVAIATSKCEDLHLYQRFVLDNPCFFPPCYIP